MVLQPSATLVTPSCAPLGGSPWKKAGYWPRWLQCIPKEWFQRAQTLASSHIQKSTKFISLGYSVFLSLSVSVWFWLPCVWVNSGSWWWTGRPGVLRFMGSQRVGHDWATELNLVFGVLVCKVLHILAPPSSLWRSPSELSERLPPRLKFSESLPYAILNFYVVHSFSQLTHDQHN